MVRPIEACIKCLYLLHVKQFLQALQGVSKAFDSMQTSHGIRWRQEEHNRGSWKTNKKIE